MAPGRPCEAWDRSDVEIAGAWLSRWLCLRPRKEVTRPARHRGGWPTGNLMEMDEAAVTQQPVPGRPAADAAIRRLLWIPAGSPKLDADGTSRIFSTSMALSGMRCMFTYVFMPILTPALGAVVGPVIGIPLAVVALVFDVRGIRTFWRVDHPQRWLMTVLYLVVMGWLAYLLIRDIVEVLA